MGTRYFPPSRTARWIQALKTPGYAMSASQDRALCRHLSWLAHGHRADAKSITSSDLDGKYFCDSMTGPELINPGPWLRLLAQAESCPDIRPTWPCCRNQGFPCHAPSLCCASGVRSGRTSSDLPRKVIIGDHYKVCSVAGKWPDADSGRHALRYLIGDVLLKGKSN